jgi:hypothetical protein
MASGFKYNADQLLNFARNSYLERTGRPIYALIFLLPFIVFYEIGTILSNTDVLNKIQDRVIAFVWLQHFLAWVAPPVVVVVILLGLQLASRKPWHFGLADFGPMAIECVLLALPLIVLSLFLSGPSEATRQAIKSGYCAAQMQTGALTRPVRDGRALPGRCNPVFSHGASWSVAVSDTTPPTAPTNSSKVNSKSLLADIVTGIGAGIYEELVFRLILMCILMLLLQDLMGLSHKGSIILSVLVSAALFSAHHHVVFVNGQLASSSPFTWGEFSFRTIAGVYFAVLFAIRGFGITAGTHAFYDIIATLINAAFFQH